MRTQPETHLNTDFVHNLQRHGDGTSEELRHSRLTVSTDGRPAIFKVILKLTQCSVIAASLSLVVHSQYRIVEPEYTSDLSQSQHRIQ